MSKRKFEESKNEEKENGNSEYESPHKKLTNSMLRKSTDYLIFQVMIKT